MSKKPPTEKDPIAAELEAALSEGSLLDYDLKSEAHDTGARASKTKSPGDPGTGPNDLWKGTIAGINKSDVIIELGPRMQGVADLSEFDQPPQVGQSFEFSVHGQEDGLWKLSRRKARALAAWNDLYPGARVEAIVAGTNSGGLDMQIGPLSGFMPASQASDRHVEDLSSLVGQKMVCEVIEADPSKKRVVLSRRRVIDTERAEMREAISGQLSVGYQVSGKVTRIESFGAFVDIGGVEGLVHVSQISRKRVEDPNELLKVGQMIDAQIVKIEEGGKRIGLSMRVLEPDPWDDASAFLSPDQVLKAKVVRVADFGAFCELSPGVDGLLHVSQMRSGGERVHRPGDLLKVGDELDVRIVSIDQAARRIGLSRLDARGALLGSEDAVDSAEIAGVLESSKKPELGTNLGNLFKRALDKK